MSSICSAKFDENPFMSFCGQMGELWSIFIYTFFVKSLTGQTGRRMFTLDDSIDTDSRKGLPLWKFVDIATI